MREGSTQKYEYQEAWLSAGPSLETRYQDEESSLNKTKLCYTMEILKVTPQSSAHTKWRSILNPGLNTETGEKLETGLFWGLADKNVQVRDMQKEEVRRILLLLAINADRKSRGKVRFEETLWYINSVSGHQWGYSMFLKAFSPLNNASFAKMEHLENQQESP